MAFYLGRAVQIVAMVGMGVALYRGFVHEDMTGELWALAIGVALFLAGRGIERRFARS